MKQNGVVCSQDRHSYSLYFDLNIWFRAWKVTGTFEKQPQDSGNVNRIQVRLLPGKWVLSKTFGQGCVTGKQTYMWRGDDKSLGCRILVKKGLWNATPSPLQTLFCDHRDVILILNRWASEFSAKNMAFAVSAGISKSTDGRQNTLATLLIEVG